MLNIRKYNSLLFKLLYNKKQLPIETIFFLNQRKLTKCNNDIVW